VPISGQVTGQAEVDNVLSVAQSQHYGGGIWTNRFERGFADFMGARHAVLCNSGSSANLLALAALELPKGSEVITCAVNFPTTVNAIIQLGLMPVFVDADPKTLNIVNEFEIRRETGAIITAHTLGNPTDFKMDTIRPVIEDCCLSKGTIIKVLGGDKSIENVKEGDFVLTRNGYKKVLVSKMTGTKDVINKLGITATPDHPFITKHGTKRLDELSASDIIYVWNQKRSSIEEKSIQDTRMLPKGSGGYIIGTIHRGISQSLYTLRYGLTTLEQFLKDLKFITRMKIHSITNYPILNYFPSLSTQENTLTKNSSRNSIKILMPQESKRLSGIRPMKVERATDKPQSHHGSTRKHILKFVRLAKNNIRHFSQHAQDFAQGNARTKAEVYNLLVENSHEFFANNILVHNCDALGSTIHGKMVGRRGVMATASFYPAHHITTGEGGAVLTDQPKLKKIIESYRDWGRDCWCEPGEDNTCGTRYDGDYDHKYTYSRIGYNLKASDFQAAVGLAQLDRLEAFIGARRANWQYLRDGLEGLPLEFIEATPDSNPSWFGFAFLTVERNKLARYLDAKGIGNRPIMAGNILRQPAYKHIKHHVIGNLTGANKIHECGLWVGCFPGLNTDQLDYTIETMRTYFDG
jgi:dTDP-4-amino-4,6-dideoxygalactose transaminase